MLETLILKSAAWYIIVIVVVSSEKVRTWFGWIAFFSFYSD